MRLAALVLAAAAPAPAAASAANRRAAHVLPGPAVFPAGSRFDPLPLGLDFRTTAAEAPRG